MRPSVRNHVSQVSQLQGVVAVQRGLNQIGIASQIHLIDLRYYKFSASDYIAEHGIDTALVLYSVPNFVTDSNLVWLSK